MTKYTGHSEDCALVNDGPCTCGTQEVLEEEMMDEIREDIMLEEME